MDIQKMRKIAGIDSKTTGQHIEDVRAQVNEKLDTLARDIQLDRLDEGLFTNIKAILNMGGDASKQAAQQLMTKASARMKKTKEAFKDAQAQARVKVFAKEMGKVEASLAKFETDPDLVNVLKADSVLTQMFKDVAQKLKDINTEVAALMIDMDDAKANGGKATDAHMN